MFASVTLQSTMAFLYVEIHLSWISSFLVVSILTFINNVLPYLFFFFSFLDLVLSICLFVVSSYIMLILRMALTFSSK